MDMPELSTLLADIGITTYVTGFGLLVSSIFLVVMTFVLIRALKGCNLSRLVTNDDGKLDQQKFWNNIAFIVATIAFVKYNFESPTPPFITELWMIYLTVLGGQSAFSMWLQHKQSSSGGSNSNSLKNNE